MNTAELAECRFGSLAMVEPYSPPTPEGYDGQVADRAELLIALGVAGLAGTGISIWGIVSMRACCLCLPGPVLTLCVSVPTWFMATADLDAMGRGEINSRGKRGTQVARGLGIIGMLGALAALAVLAMVTAGFFAG